MRDSRLLGTVVAALLATTPGCAAVDVPLASGLADAQAKAFPVPAGRAHVYVYRRSASVATIGYPGGGGYPITVTGSPCATTPPDVPAPFGMQGGLGSLYPRTFVIATVCPGPITVTTIAEGDPKLEFVAEEGKNYYVKLTALIGWSFPSARLELVADEQEAKEQIRSCNLTR